MITVVQHFIVQSCLGSLVLLQADGQLAPDQYQSGRSLLWMFVQTICALGFVCLLAYVVLKVALPRLNVIGAGKSMVHIVDRTALDQRRSLYVVEVTGRWLLIGASEGGLQLIRELDPEQAEQEAEALNAGARAGRARAPFTEAPANARSTFADVIARMVHRR
jgi:flagellar biogenesis protein FliO